MGLSPNGEVRFIVTPHDEAVELRPPMDLSFNEAGPGLGGLDVVASCRPESMFGETSFSYEGCPDGDSFDLIVFQVDGGGSNWMKWQLFANEPYLPGESKTYDIFPDQLEDAPRIEVTTVAPPADVTQLSASISAWRPDGGINRDSRGIAPSSGLWPTVWIPRTFSQTGTFELCTFLSFDAGNLTRCEPVEGPPAAVDSTTPTLARLASASIESLDPVAVSVELDSGEVGHAVEASLVWSVGTAPDIHDLAWSVYAPASAATTVTLPELPPELSAWVPPAQPPKQSTARHHRADGGSDVADAVNAVADRARRESALTAF